MGSETLLLTARRPRQQSPGGTAPIELRLIGGFSLSRGGEPVNLTMAGQRLVAYLALQGRPATRLHVAGTLWPDATDSRAMGNLRSLVWRIRRLGREIVATIGDQLALTASVTVDLHDLDQLARRVLDGTASLDSSESEALADAGEILPDSSDEWVLVERERFRQLRVHALEALCGQLAATGRYGRAVEACLAAVTVEPLRESAQRQLIKVHLSEGNRSEALRQYETYRRLIHEELGAEPSREMADLLGVKPTVRLL